GRGPAAVRSRCAGSAPACRLARFSLTNTYGDPLQVWAGQQGRCMCATPSAQRRARMSLRRLGVDLLHRRVPPGHLTNAPIAHLANPEIPQLTHPKSPRMTDVTGETWLYGEGSSRIPPLVGEGTAMRVVMADHQAGVRSALRLLATHVLGLQVVGEVTAATDLWTQVQDARRDLLLLEWDLLGAGA